MIRFLDILKELDYSYDDLPVVQSYDPYRAVPDEKTYGSNDPVNGDFDFVSSDDKDQERINKIRNILIGLFDSYNKKITKLTWELTWVEQDLKTSEQTRRSYGDEYKAKLKTKREELKMGIEKLEDKKQELLSLIKSPEKMMGLPDEFLIQQDPHIPDNRVYKKEVDADSTLGLINFKLKLDLKIKQLKELLSDTTDPERIKSIKKGITKNKKHIQFISMKLAEKGYEFRTKPLEDSKSPVTRFLQKLPNS